MSRFLWLKRTHFLTHFFEKLLVCGMHYQFLSNLPLVFSSFTLRLETFYCGSKHNCWHLHGSNPRNTSLRCRLRLGHSVLNLKKRTYRMCLCGNKEKEEHLLLNCSLTPCFELTWRNLWNQFYWKVCKIYCQVYYMIIQACCNFYYLHILRWNLNPQPICITLSLNILN